MDVTVFDRADPSQIQSHPFPHLVVENALPDPVFAALQATLPPPPTAPPSTPNQRSVLPAWMICDLPHFDPAWRAFAQRHTAPDILGKVRSLFGFHWPNWLGEPPEDPTAYGRLRMEDQSSRTVSQDCRLECITPSGETAGGSHRRAHLDSANRYFSALLYFRDPEDRSEGGGLDLFAWKPSHPGPTENAYAAEIPADHVERVLTVPNRSNTLVVFPNGP
ncbi:MAG: hypothetical protein ACPGYL_10110, partial [Rhodospirillaceae bacterium]